MLTVIVKFTVLPDRMDEFLEGIRTNAQSSLRDEPGCLRFDVHVSQENENEVLLYEIYRDQEAFEVGHRGAPHYAAWREVAARCVPDGGQVATFATPAFPSDLPEAQASGGRG
jgi:autoinducer 2-degrading protein